MPGGVIRVEEIGGVAYALTALSPEQGGSFNITGATGINEVECESGNMKGEDESTQYDFLGRRVEASSKGLYIINGKKLLVW